MLVCSTVIFLGLTLCGCSSFQPSHEELTSVETNIKGKLYARFFGTSTVFLSDGESSIMIDGFFTRRTLKQAFSSDLTTNPDLVDSSLDKGSISKVDLLLVSHSHFDHLLDSEYVAQKTGAVLMGSSRTLSLVQSANTQKIDIDKPTNIGDFTIDFYESKHGSKNWFARQFEKFFLWWTNGEKFGPSGDVYSFYISHDKGNVLFIPSSSAITHKPFEKNVDVVFLGLGLLGNQGKETIEDYWNKAVVETGAKVVIPIHWDNFYKPLANPIEAVPQYVDDLKGTVELLKVLSKRNPKKQIEIKFPVAYEPFLIGG